MWVLAWLQFDADCTSVHTIRTASSPHLSDFGSLFFRRELIRAIFFLPPRPLCLSSCFHHHSHRPHLEGHLSSLSTITACLIKFSLKSTRQQLPKLIVPRHYPHSLFFPSLNYFIQYYPQKQQDQETAIYVFVLRQRLQTPSAAQVPFISHSAKTL